MRIDPTALIENGVTIGEGTAVWSHVHMRTGAQVGRDCIIGEKTYVAGGVTIGDRVKINSFVYLCEGVTVEDGVMISAGAIFTNDRYPRATTADLKELRPSEWDDSRLEIFVREGATIGAAAVIGSGLEVGRFALVGMGAVVTRSVPDFHLVVGNPARTVASVCRCGEPVVRFAKGATNDLDDVACPVCGRHYAVHQRRVTEL